MWMKKKNTIKKTKIEMKKKKEENSKDGTILRGNEWMNEWMNEQMDGCMHE